MYDLIDKLDHLEVDLKKFFNQLELLKSENDQLRFENASLKEQFIAKEIDPENKELAFADPKIGEAKENISSVIDECIVEIDACIEYLKSE